MPFPTPPLTRRHWIAASASLALSSAWSQGAATDTAALRWIVPFPPGGGSDLATRVVAKRVGEMLGRTVVVDNKPGAATMLAAQETARAKPDGNTVLTAGMSTLTLNPSLYPAIAYQADKDFAHVTTLVRLPVVMVVPPNHPANDLRQLVAWLKAQGSAASYASIGSGSPHHVGMALWLEQQGLPTVHVPYKGTPQALQDVAGGQLAMMLGDVSAAVPLIQAKRLKAIAVPARVRNPALPEVPTFAEAGFPYETAAWQGVVAPAGTSPEWVERLSQAIRTALSEPAIADNLGHHGMEPMGSTPAEFKAYAASERQRWGALIQRSKITAQ